MTIKDRPTAIFVEVGLAPPEIVKAWCERVLPTGERIGEVTNSETIHYRTHQPIPDGLFCQRIFGPIRVINVCAVYLQGHDKAKV